MNFQDLHESVRLELARRIEHGLLTGTALARQAGFQQGHISNFLNRKRSLSLEGLDRVLAAQDLTVDQLLPLDLSASSAPASLGDSMQAIPVVSPASAMEDAAIRSASVIETLHLPASRLADARAQPLSRAAHWERFVAVRADPQQAAAMEPVLAAGATVVLDRHYNSLAPYRAHQRTLFAVRYGGALLLRYVEFDEGRLILRPLAADFPVQLIAPRPRESPTDYIVGRVCLVVSEL